MDIKYHTGCERAGLYFFNGWVIILSFYDIVIQQARFGCAILIFPWVIEDYLPL